jgi:hypothetical protein
MPGMPLGDLGDASSDASSDAVITGVARCDASQKSLVFGATMVAQEPDPSA